MKRDNLFIYVGAVVFILLAVALGIVMYMLTKTNNDLAKNSEQVDEIIQNDQNTESVSTEIGKTVEEQKSNNENNENNGNDDENNESEGNKKIEEESKEPKSNEQKNENTKKEERQQNVEEKKEITFIKPVESDEIITEFAKENLIYSETLKEWITHTGIDIKAEKTSVVKSSADGVVKSIINDPRYGLTVIISHDQGFETIYSNLLTAEFIVEGEEVTQGQTIGTAGNTASFESAMESHVHFEITKDGEYLDPNIYLK